jgi:hypothetical protein
VTDVPGNPVAHRPVAGRRPRQRDRQMGSDAIDHDGRDAPWPPKSCEFQRCEAGNPTIWLPTGLVAIEFRWGAPR